MRQYSQRKVDVLDLDANQLVTADFRDVAARSMDLPMHLFAAHDPELAREARAGNLRTPSPLLLNFDKLIGSTPFVGDMRELLRVLEDAYDHPVDIEFTASFVDEDHYRLNVVQCRPLQVKGGAVSEPPPEDIAPSKVLIGSRGPVIGQSRAEVLERIIYVVPDAYGQLPVPERYAVARLIGKLNRAEPVGRPPLTMLLGPGRWGTTTPSLGVPVTFAEINNVSILCEIVAMREDLVPDVSMGTHFFSELVEMEMLYMALFPNHEGTILNRKIFESAPNHLTDLLPEDARFESLVRVLYPAECAAGGQVRFYADALKQRVLCYIDPNEVVAP
jgi:hypothetical protein